MKFQSSKNLTTLVFVVVSTFANSACQTAQTPANQAANQAATNQETANRQAVRASSPTEAYKMLFAAVKAKDTEKIKLLMSKSTVGIAAGAAQRFNVPLEKQIENGMLETTIGTDTLPEIRDERVLGNFGAIEVFNEKTKKFDDTFFVNENGGWRLAIGEYINGSYKSPGKGRAQMEADAANPMMKGGAPNGKFPPPASGNMKTVEIPAENSNKTPAANQKQ